MATQLVYWSKQGLALLAELAAFDDSTEVWEEAGTRTAYVGNDIENNPDYDALYVGTVADVRQHVQSLIEARQGEIR